MTIYTKTGDTGMTSLFGGKKVRKDDLRIKACGSVDELTTSFAFLTTQINNNKDTTFLYQIQKDLYLIMGILASADSPITQLKHNVSLFEQKIDNIQSNLPKLNRFILPGGTLISAYFHNSRVLCRRCERTVVHLFKQYKETNTWSKETKQAILMYLNRLSDLLFVYARWYAGEKEVVT